MVIRFVINNMKKYLKYLVSASVFVIAFLAMTASAHATFVYYLIEEPYNVVNTPIDPGITVTLTASPTSMTLPNHWTDLTWTTTGGPTDCQASSSRWTGPKQVRGGTERINNLTAGIYLFDIECIKGSLSARASALVVVYQALGTPSVVIRANPTLVNTGSSSAISWRTNGDPESCIGTEGTNSWSNPGPKDPTTNGWHTLSSGAISASTRFRITCSKTGFADVSSADTVDVQDTSQIPDVIIGASPESVAVGETSNIVWKPVNAESCSASGGTLSWRSPAPKSNTPNSQNSGPINSRTVFSIQCKKGSLMSPIRSVVVNIKGTEGCLPPKVIYNGRCIDKCPAGLFLDANRQCVKHEIIET